MTVRGDPSTKKGLILAHLFKFEKVSRWLDNMPLFLVPVYHVHYIYIRYLLQILSRTSMYKYPHFQTYR